MHLRSCVKFRLNCQIFRSFSFYKDKFPFRFEYKASIDTTEKEKPNSELKALPYPDTIECKNMRSREFLGMALRPSGFQTKREMYGYFNQVIIECTNRHITAYIKHNSGIKLTEATTKEFEIARHLHHTHGVNAATNLGRVLADRCRIFGIRRVAWDKRKNPGKITKPRLVAFFKGFEESLVMNLTEPAHTKFYPLAASNFLDTYRPDGYSDVSKWMQKFYLKEVKVFKESY